MTETTPSSLGNVITIDDERIKSHLDRVVRGSSGGDVERFARRRGGPTVQCAALASAARSATRAPVKAAELVAAAVEENQNRCPGRPPCRCYRFSTGRDCDLVKPLAHGHLPSARIAGVDQISHLNQHSTNEGRSTRHNHVVPNVSCTRDEKSPVSAAHMRSPRST